MRLPMKISFASGTGDNESYRSGLRFSTQDVESCSKDIAIYHWGLCELQKSCDPVLKSLFAIKVLWLIPQLVMSYRGIATHHSFCSNYPDIVTYHSFCCEFLSIVTYYLSWVVKASRLIIHSVVSCQGIETYHSFCCELSKYCDFIHSFIHSFSPLCVFQILWLTIQDPWIISQDIVS